MLSQALLSAANFGVGLLMIRRAPQAQYGYYVLIFAAVQLFTSLQLAFIQPSLIRCLTAADHAGRREFVGGAYREQRRWLFLLGAATAAGLLALWYLHLVGNSTAPIFLAAIFATLATAYREYFRMVLLAYRIPLQALKADIFYVFLLCSGAYLATLTPAPATAGALTLGVSAGLGGWLLSRMVWRHEGWDIHGTPKIIPEIAPLGTWAVIGTAIHWTFAQGFMYIVAGTLGVTAVAQISATRLLLMPINLMTSGLGSMTFPTVSTWLKHHHVDVVFKRLCWIAAGIAGIGLLYVAAMWFSREWVFTHVVKRNFAHRDTLLLLWSAAFILMAVRDQMIYLPAACGQFRIMAWLTLATAIFSLITCYVCMRLFGVVGALAGVLSGEAFNILGFVVLSRREIGLAHRRAIGAGAIP